MNSNAQDRRLAALEGQLNPSQVSLRVVVQRQGESAEEALGRCPWARIAVPEKAPLEANGATNLEETLAKLEPPTE